MLGSPQVYRIRNFSFRMYFNEGREPPHVHVWRGGSAAKFWLRPAVVLCANEGFSSAELRQIERTLTENLTYFLGEWHAIQTRTSR